METLGSLLPVSHQICCPREQTSFHPSTVLPKWVPAVSYGVQFLSQPSYFVSVNGY